MSKRTILYFSTNYINEPFDILKLPENVYWHQKQSGKYAYGWCRLFAFVVETHINQKYFYWYKANFWVVCIIKNQSYKLFTIVNIYYIIGGILKIFLD